MPPRTAGIWALLFLLPLCGAAPAPKPGLLEVTADSFVSTLEDLPEDRWVLFEFYAHWCPACQHFQPEYEQVAAFFGSRRDQQPVITVARLDCAEYASICQDFSVGGYPTMKLGRAADLAAKALDKLTDVRPASRHYDSVVAFLEKELRVKFEGADKFPFSDAAKAAAAAAKGSDSSGAAGVQAHALVRKVQPGGGSGGAATGGVVLPPSADLNDIEGATLRAWRYITDSPLLLKGADARQALKDWVDLLADYHPVERCRVGAEKMQEALDELWPDDADTPEAGLQDLQMCPGSHFKDWASCRGSTPDQRGYTCGLWQLFHTLAARLPDHQENAGAVWLAAVKGFVGSYFQCTECAKHFMRHAGREEAISVARKRDAVLWMWKTHNIVNRRLATEEGEDPSKADAAAPHVQFPPQLLCSKCRKADGLGANKDEAVPWDEDAVYEFLTDYYSGEPKAAGSAGLAAASGAAGSGRVRQSSWVDAAVVVLGVGGGVYAALRTSGQYALRKSSSRIL